ncbi:MAG TPA: phosphatidylserine decarboxylase, partial [Elusimicrobiales bacterium]|nr:phosphatidylserine decarboxylase [Elusimicrobiales bacterium]
SGGQKISVEQIAGFIARRISCTASPGQELVRKQRIGMIRFGSPVAVYLPGNVEILVRKGQFVTPEQAVAEFKD